MNFLVDGDRVEGEEWLRIWRIDWMWFGGFKSKVVIVRGKRKKKICVDGGE